ncbi:hypothetical protein ACOBQX_11705 [Actinokineospora sp. G85]|uniref:hypothetical protein n=1 Tax=Actinokineospora sp. G85 TaxID=3406626 RepID=UPI003C70AB7A
MSMLRTAAAGSFAALTAASTLMLGAGTASASNAGTSGCINLFVEYTSAGSTKHVAWARGRNVCAPFAGHFQVYGVDGPNNNPIQDHTVNVGRTVPGGTFQICGSAWQHNGGTSYTHRGSVCVPIV